MDWTPLHSCVSVLRDILEIAEDLREEDWYTGDQLISLVEEAKNVSEVGKVWKEFDENVS